MRLDLFRGTQVTCFVGVLCMSLLTSCSSPPTIDSLGGVVLEFAVDDTRLTVPPSKEAIARTVNVIRTRLNPTGDNGVTVRVTGTGRFEVGLLGVNTDARDHFVRLITQQGSLEFCVVANPRDHSGIIESARKLPTESDELQCDDGTVAVWMNLASIGSEGESVEPPEFDSAHRKVQRGDELEIRQCLVIRDLDDERVTGQFLTRVGVGLDSQGKACVNLAFNKEGAHRLTLLTHRYSPAANGYRRRLAIIFDGWIRTTPFINTTMSDQCEITGNFTREELEDLVAVLSSGELEIPLNPTPVSERVVRAK